MFITWYYKINKFWHRLYIYFVIVRNVQGLNGPRHEDSGRIDQYVKAWKAFLVLMCLVGSKWRAKKTTSEFLHGLSHYFSWGILFGKICFDGHHL